MIIIIIIHERVVVEEFLDRLSLGPIFHADLLGFLLIVNTSEMDQGPSGIFLRLPHERLMPSFPYLRIVVFTG